MIRVDPLLQTSTLDTRLLIAIMGEMRSRQEKILEYVVSEYIHSGEPIGSQYLARRFRLDISPATIRNDFQELSGEGYLAKPHSASGRIPTNKGYRFYVDAILDAEGSRGRKTKIRKLPQQVAEQEIAEFISKSLELLAVSFSERQGLMIVGTRYLFSRPDFFSHEQFMHLGEALERLQFAAEKLFRQILPGELEVFIGKENTYLANDDISSLFAGFPLSREEHALVGILGPTRLPYEKCAKLMKSIALA